MKFIPITYPIMHSVPNKYPKPKITIVQAINCANTTSKEFLY